MKALFVLPTDKAGGAENVLKQLAGALRTSGYDVDVVFLSGRNSGGWKEIPVDRRYYFPASRERFGFIFSPLLFLWRRFCGDKYNYVFSSHTHCNSLIGVMRWLRIISAEHAVYRESTNIFERFSGLRRHIFSVLYAMYGHPSVIICQTKRMKHQLFVNVPRLASSNLTVLSNPVDLMRVSELAAKEVRADFEEIVHVGRLIPEKGVDLLIRAFRDVKELAPNLVLRLIGQGPQLATLRKMVDELDLSDSVIFHGYDENPFPYVAAAKVSVVSSRREGFPNTLLEMMCVAKCVVSTDCADGVAELPGVIVCAADSATALTQAIDSALKLNDEAIERMMVDMRNHVLTRSPGAYLDAVFAACR